MNKGKLIIHDKKILSGKPIIAGTRMSVEVVLEFLAGGMEIKEMLKEFPFLTRKQIEAAIQYAAQSVGKEKIDVAKNTEIPTSATLHEIHR